MGPDDPAWAAASGAVELPRGYIDGLITSNAADADHDINIAVGECRDSTNTYNMVLSSVFTKQIDASWAAGSAAGGLFSGSVANATWYHVFLIRKDSDGAIDAGFDTSVVAANKPAGYSAYRRIGSVLTNGSANILGFVQFGDKFLWDDSVLDVNAGTVNNSAASLVTLSVPSGVNVRPILAYEIQKAATVSSARVTSPSVNDANPNAITLGYTTASTGGAGSYSSSIGDEELLVTDTSSRIRIRSNVDSVTYWLRTSGWIDPRGKDA
jgi:hypothetical protein